VQAGLRLLARLKGPPLHGQQMLYVLPSTAATEDQLGQAGSRACLFNILTLFKFLEVFETWSSGKAAIKTHFIL
jgi:BarA-like signal transduction histidine kinase